MSKKEGEKEEEEVERHYPLNKNATSLFAAVNRSRKSTVATDTTATDVFAITAAAAAANLAVIFLPV